MERFEVPEYKDKKIKELSKGNQQKIQFITAILNEPRLLILDEPFSGLDPFNVEIFKKRNFIACGKGEYDYFFISSYGTCRVVLQKIGNYVTWKPVIAGYLKDIKEQYRKKNIFVKGDVTPKDFESIPGVVEVIEHADELEVKIESEDVVDKVFRTVSKKKHVTKFVVEEPTLNEIFVSKVGESYEK